MRQLFWAGAGTLVLALVLTQVARINPKDPDFIAETPSLPRFQAEVELEMDGMNPYRIRVPKDHEVHLLVRATPSAGEGLVTITGYEDQVQPLAIGPGQARELVFESVRPGDDFSVLLGGNILGRLEVVGSHLEEGHR